MIPRYESILGPFNSITTDFATSRAFTGGSLQVWLNEGLLSPEATTGWLELVPGSGTFRMKVAPALGDRLRVFYLDTTLGLVYQFIEGSLAASFTPEVDMTAILEEDYEIIAVLED